MAIGVPVLCCICCGMSFVYNMTSGRQEPSPADRCSFGTQDCAKCGKCEVHCPCSEE